jgi:hypothetical protein
MFYSADLKNSDFISVSLISSGVYVIKLFLAVIYTTISKLQ